MRKCDQPRFVVLVIFGGAGDLARRKLIPALYNLFVSGCLSDSVAIVGVDRQALCDGEFRERLRDSVQKFCGRGFEPTAWESFAQRISYLAGQFSEAGLYVELQQRLETCSSQWGDEEQYFFYLATPPSVIETILGHLDALHMGKDRPCSRVVVEKPFGSDGESAALLDRRLTEVFRESQIYRIDHYLGKETVQNIMAFRFANSLFEPVWNRRYIDHVQITIAEEVGVEHRGGYYEQAGALRDMMQNHLLQVMCLVAMEPPVSYKADEIRSKKVDVLRAVRRIDRQDVHQVAVRGQYGDGWIQGNRSAAYRQEPAVAGDSQVETFAALKLFVDNWRWQGIPFYLRTGKRMPGRISHVAIQFRPVPHHSFPASPVAEWQPNRITIRIQPDEGIVLNFQAKYPGEQMRLSPVNMKFSYDEAFHRAPPEAYQTLLLDVMLGDQTQFMRADQLEEAWSIIEPVLDVWGSVPPLDFPNYPAGTWGPEAAEVLIARDGRSWQSPTVKPSAPAVNDWQIVSGLRPWKDPAAEPAQPAAKQAADGQAPSSRPHGY